MIEVKVETDENGDAFIPISAFKDIIDIDKVKTYTLETKGDVLIIKFYDENGEKLK